MPVNDWIAAGKSASQGLTNLFKVARENSPDYGMLATENMKNRSKERQVANAAEATIRREGLKALTRVKKTGIEIEADEKILDQKISAKRKAGYVGALGSIALGGFTAIDNNKRKAREAEQDAAEQAIWDEWRTRQDSTLSELRGQITQMENELAAGDSGGGPIQVQRPGSLDAPASTTSPTAPSVTPPSAPGVSRPSSSSSRTTTPGNVSKAQMEQMLIKRGVPPETARTMAAVGMAESRGVPTIDTVQSGLDPHKTNEYSVGLWQINTQAHGDKLTRRGWTVDDLRDPEKNADIAVEVWQEAGQSLRPWGAYTNGSYREFLHKKLT